MEINWAKMSNMTGIPADTLRARYPDPVSPLIVARIVIELNIPISTVLTR